MTSLSFPYTLAAADPRDVNKLNSNLNAVATVLNGNVDSANLASGAALANLASASVTDAKLASPNNGALRTVAYGLAHVPGGLTQGKWVINESGTSFSDATGGIQMVPIYSAGLAVAGKTTYFRLSVAYVQNATTLGTSVAKYGLYPITAVSGATYAALNVTMGTVVTNSQAAFNSAVSSTATIASSPDFTAPSDGVYAVGLAVTVNDVPANVAIAGRWILQSYNG